MRRLAIVLAGVIAAGTMTPTMPWDLWQCGPGECPAAETVTLGPSSLLLQSVTLVIVGLLPMAVLTAILVAVLTLGSSQEPNAPAVHAALGETPQAARRRAAKQGMRDSAWAVGVPFVILAFAHPIVASTAGWPPFTQGEAYLGRALLGALVGVALVVAHVIASSRQLSAARAGVSPAQPGLVMRPRSLGGRAVILAGVAGLGIGLVAGALSGAGPEAWSAWRTMAVWGAVLFAVAVTAAAWFIGVPAAQRLAPRAVGVTGSIAKATGAERTSAVLAARASMPWLSSSRVITVLAGLAFIVGLFASSETPVNEDNDDFRRTVASVAFYADGTTLGCDAACREAVAQVAAIPGVEALIPAARVEGEFRDDFRFVTMVDPVDLDGVDDALAATLRTNPDIVLLGEMKDETVYDLVDYQELGLPASGLGGDNCCIDTMFNRAHLEASQGPMDTTSYLIYAERGVDQVAVYEAVDTVLFESAANAAVTSHVIYPATFRGELSNADLLLLGMFALMVTALVVVPIAAVATAAVARRRQDDATLAALGAPATAIRASIVIEAIVTAGLAIGAGLVGGALSRAAWIGATRGIESHRLGEPSRWLQGLESVPWLLHVTLWLIALLVFAATSLIASRSVSRVSPVEGLRPTTGVLS